MHTTEQILQALVNQLSTLSEVVSVGLSGSKSPLPTAGNGDIDLFIYCESIPSLEKREAILNNLGDVLQNSKVNVFQGGHWGQGDFTLIKGVETWLMYFTIDETYKNVDAILEGKYPDKLDNYYYPIGRCAMLKDMTVLYDCCGFLGRVKEWLSDYPEKLSRILVQHHLDELDDTEDLERAVIRKDVLFYHFALDLALDHFLQALFALNRVYFPSRKRSLEYIRNFQKKPGQCAEKLLEVIRLGGTSEGVEESYALWTGLVTEMRQLCK